MTQLHDARAAAWISAWNCVETAQKIRVTVTEVQDKRERDGDKSDASYYFSRTSQEYNALMEEARIFADLAAVGDTMVGLHTGDWLAARKAEREQQEAVQADLIERFSQRRAEDENSKTEGEHDGASS